MDNLPHGAEEGNHGWMGGGDLSTSLEMTQVRCSSSFHSALPRLGPRVLGPSGPWILNHARP